MANIDFRYEVFIIHKPNWCILIANYFRHKAPCSIRKLTAAFVSKRGVFSRFSWSLDFGAKMAEFPLPVPQIWRSRKRVTIQIQLMNIHVSECKYYCLHLVPKFGDECDRQNWRLHPTVDIARETSCSNELLSWQHHTWCKHFAEIWCPMPQAVVSIIAVAWGLA